MNVHSKIPVISARMGTHPSAPITTPGLPFPIFNPAANGGLGGWFAARSSTTSRSTASSIPPISTGRSLRRAVRQSPARWLLGVSGRHPDLRPDRGHDAARLVRRRRGEPTEGRARADQRQRPAAGRTAGRRPLWCRRRGGGRRRARARSWPATTASTRPSSRSTRSRRSATSWARERCCWSVRSACRPTTCRRLTRAGNLRYGRAFIYGNGILPGTRPRPPIRSRTAARTTAT